MFSGLVTLRINNNSERGKNEENDFCNSGSVRAFNS